MQREGENVEIKHQEEQVVKKQKKHPADVHKKHDRLGRCVRENMVVQFLRNRWVRMVVFCLACFFTSALYYGWQQYAAMLLYDGAYEWQCKGPEDYDEDGNCTPQNDSVDALYSIAAGCEYASAALGGIMLDHMGPRSTAFVGELVWAIGTVLLIFSKRSFEAYIPAMVLIGSSVNVTCFPSLVTVETFPKWQGLMVALMLSSETAATAIPIVLYAIQKAANVSVGTIWGWYLVLIWLPVTILYLIALPNRRDFGKMLKLQRQRLLAAEEEKTPQEGDDLEKEVPATPNIVDVMEIREDDDESVIYIPRTASWREFLTSMMTVDMVLMSVFFFIVMMIYAYYPTVVRRAISEDMSDYVAYITPAQAVIGLVVGVMCDLYRTVNVMILMCICIEIAMIGSCYPDIGWLQYFGSTILVSSQCAIFEVKFTYVHEMFDPYNFGKLVGVLGVVGGLGTFVNIPIARIRNYKIVFVAYSIITPIMIAIAAYLGWRQHRGVTYRTMPDTAQKETKEFLESNRETEETPTAVYA